MESKTKRFKKSTAKFLRSEVSKTQNDSVGMGRRLGLAVVVAVVFSLLYVAL